MHKLICRRHITVFFRNPKVGFPKFKSKKRNKNSYTTNCIGNNIAIVDGYIKLPKVGLVKLKQHRKIPSDYKFKSATVSQTPSGKYYVSVLFEYENQVQEVEPTKFPCLDFSMHELYKDSNGNEPCYPCYYKQAEKKLKREQRKLSRKYESFKLRNNLKGVAARQNIQKQLLNVQRIYYKLTCIRTDYINKVVNSLVKTKPK